MKASLLICEKSIVGKQGILSAIGRTRAVGEPVCNKTENQRQRPIARTG